MTIAGSLSLNLPQCLLIDGTYQICKGRAITRVNLKDAAERIADAAESSYQREIEKVISRSVVDFSRKLQSASFTPDPENAEKQAAQLANKLADLEAWQDDLDESALPMMGGIFVSGIIAEFTLHQEALQQRRYRLSREKDGHEKHEKHEKRTTAEEIAESLNIEIPPGISFGDLPEWMVEAARAAAAEVFEQEYWQNIVRTTRGDIMGTLKTGIEDGLSIDKLAHEIRGMLGGDDDYARIRARNIARTETGNLLNAGHVAGMKQIEEESGLLMGKEWLSIFGPTTRNSHAAADAQQVKVDDMFTVGGYECRWPSDYMLPAEERCNCFPGSVWIRGRFSKAMRSWYEGRFAEIITRSSIRLTLTPNHPVMTSQGWIPAGKLKPGDKVCTNHGKVEFSVMPGSHYKQDEPATISQVFESLRAHPIKVFRAKSIDFDGDGKSLVGDIDVVGFKRSLSHNSMTKGQKRNMELDFRFSDLKLSNKFCVGNLPLCLLGNDSSAGSFMGRRKPFFDGDIFVSNLRPSRFLPIGIGLDLYSTLHEASSQYRPAIPGFFRQLKQRCPSLVSFDEVIDVRYFNASCHVYDVESPDGIVTANDNQCNIGIVVSNCQCTVLSTFIMDESGEHIESEEDSGETTPEQLAAMDVQEITSTNVGLIEKHESVASIDSSALDGLKTDFESSRSEVKRLAREKREIRSRHGDVVENIPSADQQIIQQINETLDQLRKRQLKLEENIKNEEEKLRKLADKVLAIPKENRGKWRTQERMRKGTVPEMRKKVSDAKKWIASHVDASGIEEDRLAVFVHKQDGRAFYRSSLSKDGIINLIDDRDIRSGIYLHEKDSVGTAIHEFGHHVENAIPGAQKRAQEFRKYRIKDAGTSDRKMADIFPGHGYSKDELGNEDRFMNALNGDRMQAFYAGKTYPKDTEILSMGLELLYKDPIGFAKRDPEYFKFVVGVIDGTIR